MDLKLGFYVLSLNILILMVAYRTEARKMVEGNMQGKRLNFPLAQVRLSSNGDLQNKDDTQNFWTYSNQAQFDATSYSNLQNKDDTQKNHLQAKSENAQFGVTSYGNLQNKDDTQNFWTYNNNQAQFDATSYGNLQNKDDTQKNHQQVKLENAQFGATSYGDLQNKEDIQKIWTYNHPAQFDATSYGNLQNKDDTQKNHQQAKSENAQFGLSSYGDSQNKDDTQIFWTYKNQGENKHQQEKLENDQFGLSSYGDLQIKDDTQKDHQQVKTENAHIHSSSHIDPSLRVFFFLDDLKQRKELSISFPRRDLSPSPNFLRKEEADSIPFSLKELPNILQRFSFSRNSPQAKAMEKTLKICGIPPLKEEKKYCATSPEAMLDFVQEIMGEKTQIKALSTTHFSNSTPLLQKYTILDTPQEVETPKTVACHTMPYAYAIFYCHYTISKSKVFKVSLGGENGDRVEAIVVCHLDTSEWSPSHVSFRVLGISPGTSPICHFFPSDNLLWVSKFAAAQVM